MDNIIKITKLEEQMKQVSTQLVKLDKKLDKEFKEIKDEMKCYVRVERFTITEKIVFGMVGMVLMAFLGYVINLAF